MQEQQENLLRNIVWKENEVFQYRMNIENYTNMVANLPAGEWPDSILPYKNLLAEDIPHGLGDEIEDLIRMYSFRDRFLYLIRTEKREHNVAMNALMAFKARFPADQVDALVIDMKAKMDAEKAAAKAAAIAKGQLQ